MVLFILCAKLLQSCPTPCDPHSLQSARPLSSWDFPGKNPVVSCHALLQGIFQTQGQGSKPCLLSLLHWKVGSLSLVPPAKPQLTLNYLILKKYVSVIQQCSLCTDICDTYLVSWITDKITTSCLRTGRSVMGTTKLPPQIISLMICILKEILLDYLATDKRVLSQTGEEWRQYFKVS